MLERSIGSLLSIAEEEAEVKSRSLIPERRCLIAGARALVLLALRLRRKKMQEPEEGENPSSDSESGKLFKEVSRVFSIREEGLENAAQTRHRVRKISQIQGHGGPQAASPAGSGSSKIFGNRRFLAPALGILPFLAWLLAPGGIIFFSWRSFLLLPLSIGLWYWGFSGFRERAKDVPGNGCRKGACDECRGKEEEEEQRAQMSKQQFMAYVFHNIRVPFNAIVLGLGHMRASAGENSNGAAADTLDLVQLMLDCAETMTNVLDDVTDMGNWEEGRIELNRDVFDLLAVVKFLAWGLKDLLEQKQISLNIDIDPLASTILDSHNIVGDKHRTVQTLGNFLSNAVKFTPTGGKLDLEIKCEEIDSNPGSRLQETNGSSTRRSIKLFIAVNDTGAGISSDDQDKLFEADSFISSSWIQKAGVSGLGLSVAKRFIEQIGGHIGVRSREQGSTFFFSAPFPLVPVQKRANGSNSGNFYTESESRRLIASSAPARTTKMMMPGEFCCGNGAADAPTRHLETGGLLSGAPGRRKVLLVEDTRINRIILRKVLQNLNLQCDEAENGQVAVDLHREGRSYDLVLMDKEMPVMDGHEATRMLRMMGVTTPIVALTGNALQSDKELFFEAGVNEFQTKPLSRDKLIQLLARYGVESSGRGAAL